MTAIFHLPPQREAWHFSWLYDQSGDCPEWYKKILVVSVKREKGSNGFTFFPEIFQRDEPFHLNSPWNYRVLYKWRALQDSLGSPFVRLRLSLPLSVRQYFCSRSLCRHATLLLAV